MPASLPTAARPRKDAVVKALRDMRPRLQDAGVAAASLFGSVRHDSAAAGSDVDVLVSLDYARFGGLVAFARMQRILEERLGCPVDLVTHEGLAPLLKDEIIAQAERVF